MSVLENPTPNVPNTTAPTAAEQREIEAVEEQKRKQAWNTREMIREAIRAEIDSDSYPDLIIEARRHGATNVLVRAVDGNYYLISVNPVKFTPPW